MCDNLRTPHTRRAGPKPRAAASGPDLKETTVNASVLRSFVRPLTGLAVVAALLGVPAATASAATAPHAENSYCDFDSGFGCAGYGYGSDDGWDYSSHGGHHRY